MSDYTDSKEEDEAIEEPIPHENSGKMRMIRRLRTHRFYWAMAFFYSLFFNLIMIWEYRL